MRERCLVGLIFNTCGHSAVLGIVSASTVVAAASLLLRDDAASLLRGTLRIGVCFACVVASAAFFPRAAAALSRWRQRLLPRDPLMEIAGGVTGPPHPDVIARAERIAAKRKLVKVPLSQEEQLARLDTTPTPRFKLDDHAWVLHLEQEGFAVIADVAGPGDLERSQHLLWDFLEEHSPWRRAAPETWTDQGFDHLGSVRTGILSGCGVGQSAFMWHARTLPKVRAVFERVWGTSELLVSFDGANVFRPWHHGFRKTLCGWWHVDQGAGKRGRHAVQGLLSLFPADATTGGLTVVPGSHHRHGEVVEDQQNPAIDYCTVQSYCPVLQELPHRLVTCEAGDLVLWDSRTVHANTPAPKPPVSPADQLLRAVAYVCMTPKTCAAADVRKQRRTAFEHGFGTTHWPHELTLGSQGVGPFPPLATAAPEVQDLVG
uniref:Phytanoyl-CoA dioxygenase n=1 Tax=Zooxanthella nutricula TaxID=1333877 RepID=A0A7S2N9Q8_9DINO